MSATPLLLLAALLGVLEEFFLEFLLRAVARTAEPGVAGGLLQLLPSRLARPVTEVLGTRGDECLSELGAPGITQPLLHARKDLALFFLNVMADSSDELIESGIELRRLHVHRGHLFQHVLGFSVLALAVRDLLGFAGLV